MGIVFAICRKMDNNPIKKVKRETKRAPTDSSTCLTNVAAKLDAQSDATVHTEAQLNHSVQNERDNQTAIATTITTTTTTTIRPQVGSAFPPKPTASYETPVQPELSESYENYLNSSSTTQAPDDSTIENSTTTTTTVGPTPSREADEEEPSPELENRIGLSALVDGPPQPLTTLRPTRTSTSSYSSAIDMADDEYETRKSVSHTTTMSVAQIDEAEITTPMPQPQISTTVGSFNYQDQTRNRISNINDDLQALASNASASSDHTLNSPLVSHAQSTHPRFRRPLSDTYFVPQTTSPAESQHTTAGYLVNRPEQPPQFHFGDDQHTPIQDTLIPHTSVNDLLHIIKHLNLINTDNDGRTKTKDQQLNEGLLPHKALVSSRVASSALAHTDMATLESSSSPGKTVDQQTDKLPSFSSRQTAQKKEPNMSTTTRRPANYTKLISPYSANFESALPLLKNIPINRASVASLKDQIHASMAAAAADASDDDATYTTNKHDKKLKHTIKIGSKPGLPVASEGSKTQGKTRMKTDVSESSNVPVKSPKSKSKNKTPLPTSVPTSDNVVRDRPSPHAHTKVDSGDYSSAKRGERDATNNTNAVQHSPTIGESPARKLPTNTAISANQQQQQQQHQRAKDSANQNAQGQSPVNFGSQASTSTQLDPSILQSLRQKLAQAAAALAPVPSTISSYLDDPHKKAYYWTAPEQANMYLGDDHLNPYSAVPKLPRPPLTIGELARQHGIINDLRFNHHHHHTLRQPAQHSGVEDFGLLSESGLHEQLAPFSNQQDTPSPSALAGALPSPTGHDKSGQFKLDEELKQKIAIKAFEAAARDPDLSAALFGSLLGLGGPEPNDFLQQQQQPLATRPTGTGNTLDVKSPFNIMTPLPTMQDNQMAHPSQLQANLMGNIGGSQPAAKPPVNLVVADLANKWALSRMPDLVPIPLAATVPGYLIRLPNGKILAAALTNMFSIQGIQREPMGNSYKNMINHKFKGLIKPNQSSSSSSIKHQVQPHNSGAGFASLVADSDLRPTLALPAGVGFSPPVAQNMIGTKAIRNAYKVNNNSNKGLGGGGGGGLFSGTRGVLGQLLASSSRAHHQRHVNNQSKGKKQRQQEQHHHSKLDGNSISKAKMVELIKSLPIADPNESVFSFLDENELIDEPDPYQTAATNVHFPQNSLGNGQQQQLFGLPDHQVNLFNMNQQQNHEQSNQNHQTNIFEGASDLILPLKDRLSHLVNLRNSATLASDDLFRYNKRKRKSPPIISLSKPFEPILNWLKFKRASSDINRRDPRRCNDVS